MNIGHFEKFVQGCRWQFAKTYAAHSPHWYTVREWVPGTERMFAAIAYFVNKYGSDEQYRGKPYRTFYHTGWKYWTMHDTVATTNLINRTNKESCVPYRGINWVPEKQAAGYHEIAGLPEGPDWEVTRREFDANDDIVEVRGLLASGGQGQLPLEDLWL